MDWDWQAIGTIVALLGVAGSFGLTWRGQRQERQIAENSARRSEAAAALTADNTTRVIEALEQIATIGGPGAGAPALAPVKWSMRYDGGDSFRLENEGSATAHGVSLSAHESLGDPMLLSGGPDLGPGESLVFLAAPTMETTDTTITVEWTNEDGTPGRWRYPLPGKPR